MEKEVELKAQVDKLKEENANLSNLNSQNQQGIASLMAQFDAAKQMLNESLASSLQLRTHLTLFQKKVNELSEKAEADKKVIDGLNSELSNHIVRIAELENPKGKAVVDLKSAKSR